MVNWFFLFTISLNEVPARVWNERIKWKRIPSSTQANMSLGYDMYQIQWKPITLTQPKSINWICLYVLILWPIAISECGRQFGVYSKKNAIGMHNTVYRKKISALWLCHIAKYDQFIWKCFCPTSQVQPNRRTISRSIMNTKEHDWIYFSKWQKLFSSFDNKDIP